MSSLPRPRSVLIIGGGPVGLVTLRNFIERGDFENVELVERRADIGGVWYLDDPKDSSEDRPRWPSPAYPGLMGNVLPHFCTFSGYPFPPPPTSPDQPFPDLIQTQAYLQKFAEPLFATGKIRLNTEVVAVDEVGSDHGGGWKVLLKDWNNDRNGKEVEEKWDAVVIATAWYDNPKWPETEGLEEIRKKGIALHAKTWGGPDAANAFKGKRVAVVGNANSANDIAAQLAPIAAEPTYRSIRRPNMYWFPIVPHPHLRDVAPVARYSLVNEKATLHLEDGTEVPDVDNVFFGTGYAYAVPFVHVLDKKQTLAPLSNPAIKPPRVPSLHRHILYAHNPTLAFLGGVVSATPFVLGDLTSTWLALAWTGPIKYPETLDARLETERSRLEAVESIRASMENPTSLLAYHILGPEELPYARTFREEVLEARPELKEELIEWSDKMWDEKEAMFGLKAEVMKKEAARANENKNQSV